MITDIESLVAKITEEIKNFTDIAVLGLSGGADSTLVSCLCLKALGKENVYGIHMPYGETDRIKFNYTSQKLAKKLGIKDVLIPINSISDMINSHVAPALKTLDNPNSNYPNYRISALNSGNTRSRVRMCLLYSIGHDLGTTLNKRVRVIGTGNLSEDRIGFDTKGGDNTADLFPIGELFKSEVYQLLDYFRDSGLITDDLIDRIPSAGLWEKQTDESELGYSYNEMEPAIKFLMSGGDASIAVPKEFNTNPQTLARFQEVCKFVYDRHIANKHKHEAPPTIPLREFCE